MRGYKNIIIFMLIAGIILICGMLPVIAGGIQDSLESQSVTLGELHTVQFFDELTDFEKLSLIRYGVMAEVSEEKVKMNEEEVYAATNALLEPYLVNGLLPFEMDSNFLDNFQYMAKPTLFYHNTASRQSGIFWLIDLKSTDGNHNISMCIDDQDGKLMIISYYNEETNVYEESGLLKEELLEKFCEIFFGQIVIGDAGFMDEINEQELFRYKDAFGSLNVDGEYMISDVENTQEYSAVSFFWGDSQDGALDMQFVVHNNGFYNEWQ